MTEYKDIRQIGYPYGLTIIYSAKHFNGFVNTKVYLAKHPSDQSPRMFPTLEEAEAYAQSYLWIAAGISDTGHKWLLIASSEEFARLFATGHDDQKVKVVPATFRRVTAYRKWQKAEKRF